MTKWLPSILAALSVLSAAFSTTIQQAVAAFLAHHPLAAVLYASASVIVAHVLPSPVAQK